MIDHSPLSSARCWGTTLPSRISPTYILNTWSQNLIAFWQVPVIVSSLTATQGDLRERIVLVLVLPHDTGTHPDDDYDVDSICICTKQADIGLKRSTKSEHGICTVIMYALIKPWTLQCQHKPQSAPIEMLLLFGYSCSLSTKSLIFGQYQGHSQPRPKQILS